MRSIHGIFGPRSHSGAALANDDVGGGGEDDPTPSATKAALNARKLALTGDVVGRYFA